jgi:membrane protease YdiL (CAAX protease family)
MQGGLAYHQLQRSGPRGWWRPVVGAFALLVALIAGGAVLAAAATLQIAVTDGSVADFTDLATLKDPGPFMFAALLVSLALLVPVAFLVSFGLHGVTPGWLTSVAGRMRWRYLVECLPLAVLALIATLVVSSFLPTGTREEITASPNPFDAKMVFLLLVTLVLTPLQAAGEEYLFRGYLTQAFGTIVPTAFAVLVPALLFGLAHGLGQGLPIFIDRFAFGLVAGVLVVLTGGIEAGLAMHLVNNWIAFGLAIVLGNLGDALQPTHGTWWSLPGTLVQSLLYLALAVHLARKQGLATRTPEPGQPA